MNQSSWPIEPRALFWLRSVQQIKLLTYVWLCNKTSHFMKKSISRVKMRRGRGRDDRVSDQDSLIYVQNMLRRCRHL